jgi:hypothetical protein
MYPAVAMLILHLTATKPNYITPFQQFAHHRRASATTKISERSALKGQFLSYQCEGNSHRVG